MNFFCAFDRRAISTLTAAFMVYTKLTPALIGGFLLLTLLSGCATMPLPGNLFVMVVTRIPTHRQQLQHHPGLSLALKRGVSREDVTSGRLVISGCRIENERNGFWIGQRHGFAFLPEGMAAERGDIIEIEAEEADQTDGAYARFFGRFIGRSSTSESDYFRDKYSASGNAFRCGGISPDRKMRVEIYSTAKYWDYDLAAAEESRNSQIQDKDLLAGRIGIGECSPGIDSWAIWKVRIPDDLDIKVGDYIEATAGATEAPRSVGPISGAIRKVAQPPKEEFIRTQGRYTVGCSAHAKPISGER